MSITRLYSTGTLFGNNNSQLFKKSLSSLNFISYSTPQRNYHQVLDKLKQLVRSSNQNVEEVF